jgi:flagellar biosynthetic protein FliR
MEGAGTAALLAALAPHLGLAPELAGQLMAVFARVGAVVALLPGFGEQTLGLRVRLAAALLLSALVAPPVLAGLPPLPGGPVPLGLALLAEAAAGLAIGIALRLMVMVLQLAGSVIAQATAVAQIFGAGLTPEPMPAIGNLLVLAGIAAAFAAGLPAGAATMLVESYGLLPFGRFPAADDLALWGTGEVARAFALAVTLAAPFVALSLLYNLALGAINRAMPHLMVAFIGAPFVTGAALLLLMLAAGPLLGRWLAAFAALLADPLGGAR